MNNRRSLLDEKQAAKAVDLYRGGLATAAIAERFSVSHATVANALRRAGIKLDSRRHRYDGASVSGSSRRIAGRFLA